MIKNGSCFICFQWMEDGVNLRIGPNVLQLARPTPPHRPDCAGVSVHRQAMEENIVKVHRCDSFIISMYILCFDFFFFIIFIAS